MKNVFSNTHICKSFQYLTVQFILRRQLTFILQLSRRKLPFKLNLHIHLKLKMAKKGGFCRNFVTYIKVCKVAF